MGGLRWLLVVVIAVRAAPAVAQSHDGASALPGHDRVGAAQPLELGWSVATSSSYGFTESVLADDDAHHRVGASVAGSYRPTDWLAFGLRYDGRYDKHANDPVIDSDDGWIGQPTLIGRALVLRRPRLAIATELDIWFPDSSADGISADAAAIATVSLTDAVRITGTAGGRLDRSANTADDADLLSPSDRMALGVSDSHAALLGVGVSWRAGTADLFGEWTWDLLLGADAPRSRESPMRLAAGVRWSPGGTVTVGGMLEASVAARPELAAGDPLVPVEPLVQLVATAAFRFDTAGDGGDATPLVAQPEPEPEPEPEPATGSVRGRLTNAKGDPVAGIAISVAAGDKKVALVTDADGRFEAIGLPLGTAVVTAKEQPPYGGFETTVAVGETAADPVGIELERVFPAGLIRGVVRTPGGKAVRARIRVEAIGLSFETDEEGRFQFEVTPGKHQVDIDAPGRIAQSKNVRVEQDGVTILNIELYPKRQ